MVVARVMMVVRAVRSGQGVMVTKAMLARVTLVARVMVVTRAKGPHLALAVWRPRARLAHLRSMTILQFLEALRSSRAKRVRRLE